MWGASLWRWPFLCHCIVSSRAPVWGASDCHDSSSFLFMFQVVPPCGGHHISALRFMSICVFQVVPPCGGHRGQIWCCLPITSFKSCPRVGGISSLATVGRAQSGFQVVPPCGGHHLALTVYDGDDRFKSCPRVGGIEAAPAKNGDGAGFKSCPRVGGIKQAKRSCALTV